MLEALFFSLPFSTADEVPGTSTRTMDAEFADVDGDGCLDLIRAVEGAQNTVHHLDIDKGWSISDRFVFANEASDNEDIAAGDFNGDGWIDIAFANEDTRQQQLFINDQGKRFVDVSSELGLTARSNSVIAFDWDGDGDLDLVFGDDGPIIFVRNDGDLAFTAIRETGDIGLAAVQDLEAGDVNGDGNLDVIVATEGRNRLLMGDGKGGFTRDERSPDLERIDDETREADFGDVDGDGDLDLFLANVGFISQSPTGATDRLLMNDGTARFFAANDGLPSSRGLHTLDGDLSDLDLDGDLDLSIAAAFNGGVYVLLMTGRASSVHHKP